MSPRSWGSLNNADDFVSEFGGQDNFEPQLTFGGQTQDATPTEPSLNSPQADSPFAQVESSRLREPPEFYESKPLESSGASPSPQSSPLPSSAPPKPQADSDGSQSRRPPPPREPQSIVEQRKSTAQDSLGIESPPSQFYNEQFQNEEIILLDAFDPQFNSTAYGSAIGSPNRNVVGNGNWAGNSNGGSYFESSPSNSGSDCVYPLGNSAPMTIPNKQAQSRRCRCGRSSKNGQSMPPAEMAMCDGCGNCCPPKFNPKLGHRNASPTNRGFVGSSAEEFSFEENEQYPSIGEILSESVFFAELDYMFLQPSFQDNVAVAATSGAGGVSTPFNFDLQTGFRVSAGFESEFGPGFAGEYFQFDNNSDAINFISDGVLTGETRVFDPGGSAFSSLVADDPGEAINAVHSLEIHSTAVYAFKAIKLKRAWVNGRFGIQVVTVDQELNSSLLDSAAVATQTLNHTSHFSGFGPRFGLDYIRRIGHTPGQLVSSATGSLLFGDREQTIENSQTGTFSTLGADEFIAVFDIFVGVQFKQIRGEKRNTTARVGFVNQTWLNGGTAIDPNGDFGIQGISFMLGLNR